MRKGEQKAKNLQEKSIHEVLAHSYYIYFASFLLGVVLDTIFKVKVFSEFIAMPVGFFCLFLATFIILWAQKTGRKFEQVKKEKEIEAEHFCLGPYCYTRIPTHWGLLFLILGFGLIMNSFFVILLTILSFIFSKLLFLEKHDSILISRYGSAYSEYKKMFKI